MLIVVQHHISDPEAFRALGEHPQPTRPKHWRLHYLLPDPSGTWCTCLWVADSIEALRDYIDSSTGVLSTNDYFEVDQDAALGIARPFTIANIIAPPPRRGGTWTAAHPFAS